MNIAEKPGRTLSLLLVEDDPDDVLLAREALKQSGLRARLAVSASAKDAIGLLRAEPADLVLLDLRLPRSNGVEVLHHLREQARPTPCIIVSGVPDAARLLESAMLALGALQFLHKPFSASDLSDTIREALSGRVAPQKVSLQKGPVRLDPVFRRVWVGNRLIGHLPPKRFGLLAELAKAAGVIDRDTLMRRVWGDLDDPQILVKTVQRLREDLGRDGYRISASDEGFELLA